MPSDLVWTAGERDRRVVGSVLAGAVAFRLFVYLLPLFVGRLLSRGRAGAGPDSPGDAATRDG
ncbi:MAG TPA: hypothetical protein VJM49_11255 [Acidimicrobiales bacterium]|nr:hypothetical protein [Acidimicrobiales bacterium]